MPKSWRSVCFAFLCAAALQATPDAQAAEYAQGIYVLGNRGPLAGVTPPPGFYFESETYYYSGDLGGGRVFQGGGVVAARVKNDTSANFATPIWVTPVEILGGNLGFSLTIPFGTPNISAGAVLASPRIDRVIAGREHDAVFNVGDIYLASFVGWHSGNWHWSGTLLGVVPSGSFQNGQLSNIALNRPALDLSGALTYLDPVLGYELSVVPGITFNWINPATQYLTGTEFHLEWSASKYLSKELSIGLVGYYYDQLTGDSGAGNRIGPFKGRVTSLGGQIGYTFKVGEIPVSTNVRFFREFDVRNRFTGTATYLSISAPLWVAPPKPVAEAKPLVTKY
ncbi:SphA family protein [Methylobacterium durans]|uniref:Phenol degradation protein meta n=1 Tax=Methylobacterium durans TaxID=2202825 RepID=A0A2U8WH80_9HYPH|nr:transporter [Methylobacterium durans]AWN44676.1 phenol degradation protein meta [Methylobacterium durans]